MAYRSVGEVKAYAAQMLHQHQTEVALSGSTTQNRQDLLARWLTRSFDKMARFHQWPWLAETRDFSWPAGTPNNGGVLYLPDYVYKIYSVYQENQNYPVLLVDKRVFDRARPASPINRGQDILVQWGQYGVEADTVEGVVTATSTDLVAGENDNLQVRLSGLTGSGATARTAIETLILAGGGASTATSTTLFSGGQGGVRRVSIVPDTVPTGGGGLITITATGGSTLERLDSSREREHQHIRTELFAQSGSSSNYQVSFYRRTFDPDVDTDIIEMPQEFQDILEDGVMIEVHKFLGNPEAAMAMMRMRHQDLRELVGFSTKQPGVKRTLSTNWARRGLRGRRFS